MANVFSASEIVELGIKIEENGRDFYGILLKFSKNDKAKALFKILADEEAKHIESFRNILDNVKRYDPAEAYPEEYFSYIKALSKDNIFTKDNKGAEVARNIKDDQEAIDLGIKFERESILFYENIKKVVLESEKNIIDTLIEEEKKHLNRLLSLKGDKHG